jgi:hypothetical protein
MIVHHSFHQVSVTVNQIIKVITFFSLIYQIIFVNKVSSITNTNEGATARKGGLFDDLQDLLVDQSTGQKISSMKR